jgi:SAM-dependent methyltransferase
MTSDQTTFWEGQAEEGTRFTAPGPGAAFFRRIPPDHRLLDLGCGYGRILSDLYRRGHGRLTGVDCSPAMLRRAQENGVAARLAAGSAGALPFRDGVFDGVLAVALFTCIPDLDDQRRVAAEIHRVLRPGGLLFASLFLRNGDARNRERYSRMAGPGSPDWGLFRLERDGLLRHHGLGHVRHLFRRFNWLEADLQRFHTMGGHSSRGLMLLAKKEGL